MKKHDLSVIGSFNMDMRSAYLDTELMLVIRSKDINKQLEESMVEYERVSRQVLEDGTYRDPYHVEPIELTKKRQRKIFLGLCMATFIAPVAMAQYPQLTEEAKQAYQKMMSEEPSPIKTR